MTQGSLWALNREFDEKFFKDELEGYRKSVKTWADASNLLDQVVNPRAFVAGLEKRLEDFLNRINNVEYKATRHSESPGYVGFPQSDHDTPNLQSIIGYNREVKYDPAAKRVHSKPHPQSIYERANAINTPGVREFVNRHDVNPFYKWALDARQEAFQHLVEVLKKHGEGYSALERFGSKDPMADLGTAPQDYISAKLKKINGLLDFGSADTESNKIRAINGWKEMTLERLGYAMMLEPEHRIVPFYFHFSEILQVCNRYKLRAADIEEVKHTIGIFYHKMHNQSLVNGRLEEYIDKMQTDSFRGLLKPENFAQEVKF